MWRKIVLSFCLVVPACGNATAPATDRAGPPDEALLEIRERPEPPPLPEAVTEKRDAILAAARTDSLRRLSRLADGETAFLSNLAGSEHFTHWDLMRRTGFDPNRTLIELLDGPYDVRTVGGEVWFVWPDLAARPVEELAPERLSFRDRARLEALIGAPGLAALARGEPYPGVRTAISESGDWRYFLHEPAAMNGETQ